MPKTNWGSCYVGICVNEGIFELTDNRFRPYESITVNEAYQAVRNLMEKEGFEADNPALLVNIDTEGMERDITRAEFAQLWYNYKTLSSSICTKQKAGMQRIKKTLSPAMTAL